MDLSIFEALIALIRDMGVAGQVLVVALYTIWGFAWLRIFQKAGYSATLGILMLVPIANVFPFLVLVFDEWPIEKEMAKSGVAPPGDRAGV